VEEQRPNQPEANHEADHIMSPKEAARYLGFHLVTIYRLLKRQEIPGIKIGKQWRFKKEVLDRWFDERSYRRDGFENT